VSNSIGSGKVWLIGGTSESAELALALKAQGIPFVVTVTTEPARDLYSAATQVVVGKLTAAQMETFVQQQQVRCVLDASHPFAQVVSERAIAVAQGLSQVTYIRYEREQLCPPALPAHIPGQTHLQNDAPHVCIDTSLAALLNSSQLCHQRILFTLGYRMLLAHLAELTQLRQTSKLFVRILPSPEALSAALAAGFGAQEIVALRPPISEELEKALWQQWNLSLVVAKASGQAGGEATKRRVAADLGVQLRLLARPAVAYPCQTDSISAAIAFCAAKLTDCSKDPF